ncbi:MAG TPA: Ig-like domain-containing protein [Kofleriaceae bacterium]|nr:Ig-like domain-containing protein [Kofleriaceae bacterium]
MSTASQIIRIGLVLCALAPAASAERKVETYESGHYKPMRVRIPTENNSNPSNVVSSRLVYLRRCPIGAGCALKFGSTEDSRTDTSTIVNGQRIIGEFTQTDEVWQAQLACVKKTFEPFNIQVTDVDPGNVPHFENIVGGKPTDLGRTDLSSAGGVAPFTCGEVPNAIVFTFDVWGADAEQLCAVSAQEVAHAFGLDHEFLQKDPMTYIIGDLPKRFRDVNADCGELETRPCDCAGRAKQNSYRMILNLFGPGAPTPPEVTFTSPSEGREIQPGFRAVIKALDDVRIAKVELYADGMLIGMSTTEFHDKFYITGPTDLSMGPHTLEARAYDVQDVMATTTISVNQGPPCTASKGCTGSEVCVSGICLPGPDEPGGLGDQCQSDAECLSQHCTDGGEKFKHCTETCDPGNSGSCPNEFECLASGGTGVCWPAPDSGCCDAGTTPQGPLLLGVGVLALVLRRRRRR